MLPVTVKQLFARKRRLTGMVVAIGLGVAFLAGALTLGDTLNANFSQLFSTATSGISVVVRSATTVSGGVAGTRPPIPASLVTTVRRVPGVAAAQPSITGLAELLGFLRQTVGELGQTVVMVTHDPAAAAAADSVTFLADGRIVGDLVNPGAETILDRLKQLGEQEA